MTSFTINGMTIINNNTIIINLIAIAAFKALAVGLDVFHRVTSINKDLDFSIDFPLVNSDQNLFNYQQDALRIQQHRHIPFLHSRSYKMIASKASKKMEKINNNAVAKKQLEPIVELPFKMHFNDEMSLNVKSPHEATRNRVANSSALGNFSKEEAMDMWANHYGDSKAPKAKLTLSFDDDNLHHTKEVKYSQSLDQYERSEHRAFYMGVRERMNDSNNNMWQNIQSNGGDMMKYACLSSRELELESIKADSFTFGPVPKCTTPCVLEPQVDVGGDHIPRMFIAPNNAGTRDYSHLTNKKAPVPTVQVNDTTSTVEDVQHAQQQPAAPVQVIDTTSTADDVDMEDVDMEDVEEPVIEEPIILATAPATPTKLYLSVGSWKKLLKPKLQPTLAPIAELVILATAPANPTKLYMRAGEWKKSLKPKFQPTLAPIAEPMILATAPATPTKLDMDIGTWKKFLKPKFRPTLEPIVEVLATAPHEPTKLRLSVGSWKKLVKPKLQPTLEPIVEVLATAPHEPTKLRLSVGSWKKLVKPKLQPTLETTMEEDEQQQQEEYLEAEPTDNDTRRLPPRRSARLQAKQNVRTPTVEPERPVSRRPKRRRQPPGFYKESLTYRQG